MPNCQSECGAAGGEAGEELVLRESWEWVSKEKEHEGALKQKEKRLQQLSVPLPPQHHVLVITRCQ